MAIETYDVAVVGAGQGGIYASYRLAAQGYSVIGIDGGADFGGVWYHNNYPGARVDSDSVRYCFQFSTDLYKAWQWEERYADAPTLLEYLKFVADRLQVRPLFRFNTWLTDALWSSEDDRWYLTTARGDRFRCRFVVMCTGVLSRPKTIEFPGLESFKGQWIQTSRWSHKDDVEYKGRRVAIVGTGSSGVQTVPVVAREAEHLFVMQRHPHYAIPARNRRNDPSIQDAIAQNLEVDRTRYIERVPTPGIAHLENPQPAGSLTTQKRLELLEYQWEFGGHGMSHIFSDVRIDHSSNAIVANFVREKIKQRIGDYRLAERLTPRYPIATRRLIMEIDYYESFRQDNVTLVDLLTDPLVELNAAGIRTRDNQFDVDLVIFAIGFQSFFGPLVLANIRNDRGQIIIDVWSGGPLTLYGMMTPGFPNMFHPTSAGSPSVLGNAMLQHEFMGDWIADCLRYMEKGGYASIEASLAASESWRTEVDEFAQRFAPLRRAQNQYMVHINPDGSRFFLPFSGGLGEYVSIVNEATSRNYAGFEFRRASHKVA